MPTLNLRITIVLGEREYQLLSSLLLDPAKVAELQTEVARQAAVSANVDEVLRDQKSP